MARFHKALSAILVLLSWPMNSSFCQQEFGSPKEAAQALADAVKAGDRQKVLGIFGNEAEDLVSSGDEVADQAIIETFRRRVNELIAVSLQDDVLATLVIGKEAWPFPIPLVKESDKWKFDVAAGREIVLARRVGENELNTIKTVRSIVNAQKAYHQADYDGDGVLEYAQKLISTDGEKDGLYWFEGTDEPVSPLGTLFSKAQAEGYTKDNLTTDSAIPYHGYQFRILTGQGANAHGGEHSYVINGNMIAGFAIIAWPVQYGSSGVMTFVADAAGDIWSADLGAETSTIVSQGSAFNPGPDWLLEE